MAAPIPPATALALDRLVTVVTPGAGVIHMLVDAGLFLRRAQIHAGVCIVGGNNTPLGRGARLLHIRIVDFRRAVARLRRK
jgi:hypothetical protein